MKRLFLLAVISFGIHLAACTSHSSLVTSARADETVTVTATSSDISENLNLQTVATLFGQAKDLENFEQMLNNPDSAFSNLDLNGDGEVDYLRVIEVADGNHHLVVIQAVLAKDIYQDVASILVEKDETTNSVTVQVVGDEYVYGENYIIEPVYIYRPVIYDWFWGPSWVCWHSPYYWGYWPGWWRPYHCIDPFLYWDHCYWHHYHHPICSYRTGYHHHHHYYAMRDKVHRNDYAHRHPERSFTSRNASRNVTSARQLEQQRRTTVRQASANRATVGRAANTSTRVSASSTRTAGQSTRNATYGSSNIRRADATTTRTSTTSSRTGVSSASRNTANRTSVTTRTSATRSSEQMATPSRTTTNRASAVDRGTRTTTTTTTPVRSSSTSVRSSATVSRTSSTPTRSSTTVNRSSSSATRSSSSAVRSSSSSSMRSSGSSMRSSGSSMRSSGSSSSRSSSAGSRTR